MRMQRISRHDFMETLWGFLPIDIHYPNGGGFIRFRILGFVRALGWRVWLMSILSPLFASLDELQNL